MPLENNHNKDEKGVLLGKNLPLQYIFSSQDDERYTMQLESLDLVALWEGISGDGGAILPVLVLPKGQMM